MGHRRASFALALASLLTGVGAVGATPGVAIAADPVCDSMSAPVHQLINSKTLAALLTPWSGEIDGAADYGYADQGVLFAGALSLGHGLSGVHRLYRAGSADFGYAVTSSELSALTADGFVDQGIRFYAATSDADCLAPVYSYSKGYDQRLATSDADRDALTGSGWTADGVIFYAVVDDGAGSPPAAPAPPADPDPSDPTFTFAVLPDTQQEVLKPGDPRFLDRTQWLADHEASLDLRFATHTGDVVNWDTADHGQYQVASAAMKPLESAEIPYTLAIGNHDTQATGVGGSARDPANTYALQRNTTTFNAYFNPARYGEDPVEFEPGKVDNLYVRYSAGGVSWMVLVLELWPRASVVSWAKQQVAAHPDDNVIVVTHDYLSAAGGLEQTAPYGNTTPQQLYDQLIKQYPNIKMVFSGHVGQAYRRIDTGVNGNKIYSYLGAFHSDTTNPVRLVSVDTASGTVKTWIYCPDTDDTWSQYTVTDTGVSFVR